MRSKLAALALLTAATAAHAQAPDAPLFLRVETGVHQATINRMVLLGDGKSVATVSDDKTARLWSIDGLKPLGVIRPPIGQADDGVLDAATVHGGTLAIGGRIRYGDQFGVQFYRTSDLKLVGHLSNLSAPISALHYSADGSSLAVGMVASRGLAFYDMTNGRLLKADSAYDGQVQWIDVDASGRTVATGEDGHIRLYRPDHTKQVADAVLPNGARAYGVAFSPDGRFIAAGVQNSPLVWLLDAANLHRVRSFSGAPGRIGGFGVVAFTADGRAVLGAGTYKSGPTAPRLVRRWALDSNAATEFTDGSDTVTDLVPLAQGMLLSDAVPTLSELDANGAIVVSQTASQLNFRDAGLNNGFAVSDDGTAVELPAAGGQPLVFDVAQRSLVAASQVTGLSPPAQANAGLQVTGWQNSQAPKLNGRPIGLEKDETSLAAAVAHDGSMAALGSNFFVRFLRRDGTSGQTPIPSPAWAVNVSADGALVIAGLGDGTIRWFSSADGNELLAMFLDPATQHWVLSTPEGFFDHDEAAPGQPDGRNLIGYRYNDPPAQISHFVENGQFYPVFYRPDLVGLALRNDPAARQAIRNAHEQHGPTQAVINRGLPATVGLLDVCGRPLDNRLSGCPAARDTDTVTPSDHPGAKLATTADAVLVRFRLSNPGGEPGNALIFRDAASIAPALFTTDEDDHSRTQEALIPLGDSDNTIKLLPVSSNGEVEGSSAAAVQFTVFHTRPAPPALSAENTPPAHRKTLFLLSVGINNFAHTELALDNASSDAKAVAGLMNAADPPVYDAAVVTTLVDQQATVAGITAALKAIAEKAQPDDLVVLFLAGHGAEVDGRYYYAPVDIGTRDPALFERAISGGPQSQAAIDQLFRTEGLGPDQLLPLIQSLSAARVAMILDTCYSGSLATQDSVLQRDVNSTVANSLGHATGRFVLSSATTLALDSAGPSPAAPQDEAGHGLFTSYLLKALEGKADLEKSGQVTIVQLATYTIGGVKKYTANMEQKQVPTFYFAGNDFFALHTDADEQ
jgi:WD40 repeat protein